MKPNMVNATRDSYVGKLIDKMLCWDMHTQLV